MIFLIHSQRFMLNWRGIMRGVLACALFVSLAYFPQPSAAAPAANTWYVTVTGNDAKDCRSLANACRHIKTAMSKALPGDTINIGAGTYFENLDVLFELTLQGAGAGVTIVDGGDVAKTVSIELSGSNSPANLNDLTLQHGRSSFGGGLYVGSGQVDLTNVNIINNTSLQGGAGIFNQGRMDLTNVLINSNQNAGSDRGGGLLNLGQVNLLNVTVSDNTAAFGGGIGNRGTMTITDSLIDHNLNASQGGGIANNLNGQLTLINTTISNHLTGSGLHNTSNGRVIISGGVITHNWSDTGGGGIYNLGQLTLNGTGLYNNRAATSFGGGLFNEGNAILNNVTLQGNLASSGSGGGLYAGGSNGSLALNDSMVRSNQATSGNGGGLYVANGDLTIDSTQIMNNTTDSLGGGLYNATTAALTSVDFIGNSATTGGGGLFSTGANSSLVYVDGTLSGNRAAGNGGGLYNTAGVNLRNLLITNNRANNGGGLFNDGQADLTDNTLARNIAVNGGGLYNGTTGHLTVAYNSLHDNFAQQFSGGGIDNRGNLKLVASTIYSNTSGTQGGSGLYNAAQAQIINSTLSYNRVLSVTNGGAILNSGGALVITNTTVSTNYGPSIVQTSGLVTLTNSLIGAPLDGGNNCVGALNSLGHNLESGTSCGLSTTGDITNTDPLLGPLTNNGGPTLTRILQSGSRAIDAANNATCPASDQRGVTRPQGSACDIGAYEIIGFTNSVTQTVGGQACITSTQVISSGYIIGTIHVGLNLAFEPRGELRVNLFAPNKTAINLLGATGGSGQNLDVLWDDDATQLVGTENHDIDFPFYKYQRLPDHSLTPLFGRSLQGKWQLEICNTSSVITNTATLNRWSLVVPSFGTPKVFLPLIRR